MQFVQKHPTVEDVVGDDVSSFLIQDDTFGPMTGYLVLALCCTDKTRIFDECDC